MKPRERSSAFGAGAAELHSNSRQTATLRRPDDPLDVLFVSRISVLAVRES